MYKVTRAKTKEQFRNDIDYGKPEQLMDKLDAIFNYVEELEADNRRLYKKNNTLSKHNHNLKERALRVNIKNRELKYTLINKEKA